MAEGTPLVPRPPTERMVAAKAEAATKAADPEHPVSTKASKAKVTSPAGEKTDQYIRRNCS